MRPILAATGHRPGKLGGYHEHTDRRLLHVASVALGEAQPRQVISGLALGWDQTVAIAALNLGIPLTAAIPFRGQESRWPYDSQRLYNDILARAEIVIVSAGGYAHWKMQRRNEWMMDHCEHVLALWNGSSGGTANCLEYARAIGRPVTNVWSRYA